MSNSKPQEPLQRLTSVAQRVGKSEATVRRWADSGKLPCLRDSAGQRLFLAADVEAFAKAHGK